jgi:putative spermidine/putrescine transport system ATP-binding protein
MSNNEATSVRLESVVKHYGSNEVLHWLDLEIRPGEFLSLLGPSGCGKTTVLRLIAGLENLTSGSIYMNDTEMSGLPANKRDIGMVFQSYSLFPHLSVLDNTRFGLDMRKVPTAQAKERAAEALELVGLAEFASRYPHELSGGQQQRVALARALVVSPQVLLLDEPLSALDAKVRVQLREEIRALQQRIGITTIFVTHDQEEALAISDRIAVMSEGVIEQIGTPEELYLNPATDMVADFVGLSNLVPCQVTDGLAEIWGVKVPVLGATGNGPHEAFVRPESVQVVDGEATGVELTVETSIFLGSLRRTTGVTSAGYPVTFQHDAAQRYPRGTQVRITLAAPDVIVRKTA